MLDRSKMTRRPSHHGAVLWIGLQSGRDEWDAKHTPGDRQNIKSLPGLAAAKEQSQA